jgi:sentrin-specific protease 1
MEGIVYHHHNPHALCITPSSLTYKRGLKRAAPEADAEEHQRPSPDIPQSQEAAPTRVITGMLATIPQSLWYFGATLINGLVDLIGSRHAPLAQQQAAQQHAAISQPTQITSVATDHSDRKRRAVDTSPINGSHSKTSPIIVSLVSLPNRSPDHSSPTTRVRRRQPMHLPAFRRVHGVSAAVPSAAFDRNSAQAKEAANRAAWYREYHDPTLANLAKKTKLAKAQQSTATTQPIAVDKSIPIKDRQIGGLIEKARRAQGTTTAQKALQQKKAAEEQAAAEREAADIAAAEEAANLEKEKEKARIAAEEEKQRIAIEETRQREAAELEEEQEFIRKTIEQGEREQARREDKPRRAAELDEQQARLEEEEARLRQVAQDEEDEAIYQEYLTYELSDEDKERIATGEREHAAKRLRDEKLRSRTVPEHLPDDLQDEIHDFCEQWPKNDRDTLIQVGSIPLQTITFKRILSCPGRGTDSWLDDDAVNAWYNLLVETKKQQTGYVKSDTNAPAFANLQTAWYAKYSKEKAKGLKRWLKRSGVGGVNMLKCERIFLPVNTGNHWTLLIINGVDRSIEYLDSLGGNGTRFFEIARDILRTELGDKFLEKEWTDLKRNHSSRQNNMDDCGVFTCMNGLAAAKGISFRDVTWQQMDNARRMIAGVFLNKGFDGVVIW